MKQYRFSASKGLLIALTATILVYIPSLFSYFQRDDWAHLLKVASPGHNPWSFGDWFYRPLFLIEFGGLYKAFGLNAVGWHAFALLVHLVNVALVYLLARRLKFNDIAAMVGAAAFGVFPMSTNAVGWLSALSGVTAVSFCLAAVHIALTQRIPVLLRGILCCVVWTPALFFKEEAAAMIVVLPFLPLFITDKRSRRERAIWFASCLLMVGALAFFVHIEGQCHQVYGNPKAHFDLQVLRRASIMLLWPFGMGPTVVAVAEIWMIGIIAIMPALLWRRYITLRPALFWFIGTGMAIGIAIGFLTPADRYFYIPSIGIALGIAALAQRLSIIDRPISSVTRIIVSLLVMWVMSIGDMPAALSIAVGLIVFMWQKPSNMSGHERSGCIGLLAVAVIFNMFEVLSRYTICLGYYPEWLNVVAPLPAAAVIYLCNKSGERGWRLTDYLLCSCLVFWTRHPAELVLLVALILAPFLERKLPVFRVHAARPIATAVVVVLVLPWSYSSFSRNMSWLKSGRQIESAVAKVSITMRTLPQDSHLLFVDRADFTNPESRILQVTSKLIAKRPDIEVDLFDQTKPNHLNANYKIVCDRNWNIELYSTDK